MIEATLTHACLGVGKMDRNIPVGRGWRTMNADNPRYAQRNFHVPEFSRDQVSHLAKLSRLALSEDELQHFASQIDDIIDTVSTVRKVETDGVEPMSHPHSIMTAMREDKVVETLTAEQALEQAPSVEEQRFAVPQILGEQD